MRCSFCRTAVALAAAGLFLACSNDGSGAGGEAAQEAASDSAPEAPSLVAIMQQLEVDMERVAHGVWVEDYDSIAAGAQAIADHPKVGAEERAEIMGILGDRGAGFREADMRVHDDAVALAGAARARSMGEVLDTLTRLQAGCVACHTAYRQPIQEGRE